MTPAGQRPAILPWQVEPYRLWSLLDMLQSFAATDFGVFLSNFERACSFLEMALDPVKIEKGAEVFLRHQAVPRVHDALEELMGVCRHGNVPISFPVMRQVQRLAQETAPSNQAPDHRALLANALTTRQAIADDLSQHFFFYIDGKRRQLVDQKEPPFGESVANKFGNANRDVEAAARCLALSENTACVFHLMRVLQYGLVALGGSVGLDPDALKRENWKNIIDQIEKRIREIEAKPKSSPIKADTLRAYSAAATQFRYFKDAWRNHVAHGEDTYDERTADAVFNHTREFMQDLAGVV